MAKLLKLRRGSTSAHASFTGAEGEVTIDTTKDTAVVHDGSQAGGRPLAREDMSNVSSASIAGQLGTDSIAVGKIAAGTLPSDVKVNNNNIIDLSIANADVNASAAIAGTKISPDFGSQNITTTGTISSGSGSNQLTITHSGGGASHVAATGDLVLKGTDNVYIGGVNNETHIKCTENGAVQLFYDTSEKASTRSNGFRVFGNLDVDSGVDVTGNITVSGTVDGRDVASDGSKLDGIESGATGDQTAAEIRTLVESASDSNVFTDADHSKLNGIESGATADQTASEILTLIKTVDGAGSGLDADTLDGISSGSFVRNNSGAQSIAGNLTVGSGTASYIYMVDSDHGNRSIHNNSNQIGFLKQDGNWGAYCDDNGNWTAAGNVTAYSDSRLKTDISTINDALGIVGKLRGVSYKWLRDGSDGIGVIAQEVEEILPSVVVTNEVPGLDGMEEVKSVDYGKIVGVLINAINELKAEVDELKGGK